MVDITTWSQGNPFVGDGLPDPDFPRVLDARASISPGNILSGKTDSDRPKRINSQAKGKRAERTLATWWRTRGFPDAARYVKTGDRCTVDGGDLVLEHEGFRLVIEVKHHAGGLTDGQLAEYGAKLVRQVQQSNGTMGILVERRDRVSDAGRWWVHLDPWDFAGVVMPDGPKLDGLRFGQLVCRTTVGFFADSLTVAGLTIMGADQ